MNTEDVNRWQINITKETTKLINLYLSRLTWISRMWFTYKKGNVLIVKHSTGEVWYIKDILYDDYAARFSQDTDFLPKNVTLRPIRDFYIKSLKLKKGGTPYRWMQERRCTTDVGKSRGFFTNLFHSFKGG